MHEDSNDMISVFSGPIYGSTNPRFIGRPPAEIPAAFFKIVCFLEKGSGNLTTRAFIYTQDAKTLSDNDGYSQEDRKMYQVSTTRVEESTGLIFPDQLKTSNPVEGHPILHPAPKLAPPPKVNPWSSGAPPSSPPAPSTDGPTKIGTPIELPNDAPAVFIAAAYINPKGRSEASEEWITITNYSPKDVDMEGWTIEDQSDRRKPMILSGDLLSGASLRLGNLRDEEDHGGGSIVLTNGSGALTLRNASGGIVNKVEWTKSPPDGQVTVFNAF